MYYEANRKLSENNEAFIRSLEGEKRVAFSAVFDGEKENFWLAEKETEGGYWLHHPTDRDFEFKETLKTIPQDAELIVLFGIGNGEILRRIRQDYPKVVNLIIIEPLQDIVKSYMERYSIAQELERFAGVTFLINQPMDQAVGELKGTLDREEYHSLIWGYASLLTYKNKLKQYDQALQKALYVHRRFHMVNQNTINKFQDMWTINFWRSLPKIRWHAESLDPVFKDQTVIIVSAGPSLQKQLPFLNAAKEKAILIAVGSAMKVLETHGIVPHFRVAIDMTVENRELFGGLVTEEVPLLYASSLFFDIIDNYHGPAVHMRLNGGGYVSNYMGMKVWAKRRVFRSGFTVANVAFDAAAQLGAKQIVLIGQDLCYTDGKLHADGAWDEETEKKWTKQEIEAKDIFGNKVYTDSGFLGMREIFEIYSKEHAGKVKSINATEGGLAIEGIPNQPFAEVMAELAPISISFEEQIKAILQEKEEPSLADDKTVRKEVGEFISDLKEVQRIYKRLFKLGKEIEKSIKGKKAFTQERAELASTLEQLQATNIYLYIIKPVFEEKHKKIRKALVKDKKGTELLQQQAQCAGHEAKEIQGFLKMNIDFAKEFLSERTLIVTVPEQ